MAFNFYCRAVITFSCILMRLTSHHWHKTTIHFDFKSRVKHEVESEVGGKLSQNIVNENNVGQSGDKTLMLIVGGGGVMCLVISTVFVCFWGCVCQQSKKAPEAPPFPGPHPNGHVQTCSLCHYVTFFMNLLASERLTFSWKAANLWNNAVWWLHEMVPVYFVFLRTHLHYQFKLQGSF